MSTVSPTRHRPRFYLRVNGLAATSDTTRAAALRAAERGMAARPDAVVELVEVDPTSDREVSTVRLSR